MEERPIEGPPGLSQLGYDAEHATALAALGREGLVAARVARASRSWCWTWGDDGEVVARIGRRLAHEGEVVVVGDFVALERRGDALVVAAVLPRRTRFVRRAAGRSGREQIIAANVDVAVLVMGLDRDYNPRRMERYLALVHDSGAEPVVVLNKADLCQDVAARHAEIAALAPGTETFVVSARSEHGLDQLLPLFAPGQTLALLGSSGVGKSTLLNWLAGEERMRTAAVRESDDRGRHTTTHRELVVLPSGALVIDNPGMRELGLSAEATLEDAFADVAEVAAACRFADCRHGGEPGCAVAEALARGTLSPARLASFEKLRRELEEASADRRARAYARPRRRRR